MLTSLWQGVLSDLSAVVDGPTFETWFRPLQPKTLKDDGVLTISAANQFVADFLEQHYKSKILSIIKITCPCRAGPRFCRGQGCRAAPEVTKVAPAPLTAHTTQPTSAFNRNFTFDSFIAGPGNEFAKSAALAVAKAPGKTKFNPLLIYGGVGLGKTHLLQATGIFMRSQNRRSSCFVLLFRGILFQFH